MIDHTVAQRFLDALEPDGRFTFQTFDDSPAKRRNLARVLHGTLAQHFKELALLNAEGAGVFVTVNRTDLTGRLEKNVTGVRALFIDGDGVALPGEWHLKPAIIVKRDDLHWHAYWPLQGDGRPGTIGQHELLTKVGEHTGFYTAQKRLARHYGADLKICDLPRVMRIPGFLHSKEAPVPVALIRATPDRFTLAEVLAGVAALPVPAPLPTKVEVPAMRPAGASTVAGEKSDYERAVMYLETVPGEGQGGRNDGIYLIGLYLLERFLLTEGEFGGLLAAWNARCSPPLEESEARQAIAQSWKSAHAKGLVGSKRREWLPARPVVEPGGRETIVEVDDGSAELKVLSAEERESQNDSGESSSIEAVVDGIEAAGGGGGSSPAAPDDVMEPLGQPGAGKRPEVGNFYFEPRYVPDKDELKKIGAGGNVVRNLGRLKELGRKELVEFAALARLEERLASGDSALTFDEQMELAELRAKHKDVRALTEAEQNELDALKAAFKASIQNVSIYKPVDRLRRETWLALKKWPHRIAPPGTKSGLLFADIGDGYVWEIEDPTEFTAFLQEYARVKFNRGQDADRVNYVSVETLYTGFCVSDQVPTWAHVELCPHEPPMRGHYYAYRAPLDYVADGRYLAQLITQFNNIVEPVSRAVYAAALLTPFWGGPYGQRPAFVNEGKMPGSGKTTAAEVAGFLTSHDGPLMVNLDKHSEDRLKERFLSPQGMKKRVALVDNVHGNVASALLEELVTTQYISGKRMFHGEASRPNSLTYFITANNARLRTDMARRSFYIEFEKPAADPNWRRGLNNFLHEHREKIIADCLFVLRQPSTAVDWKEHKNETFSLWVDEVLAKVLAVPVIRQAVVGEEFLGVADVLRSNQAVRNDTDEELDEATTFMQGLCEYVCNWKGFYTDGVSTCLPKQPVFIRTAAPPKKKLSQDDDGSERETAKENNMVKYWENIFAREINAKWLANTLDGHIASGRIKGLWRGRKSSERGYYLEHGTIAEFLEQLKADREKEASDASQASCSA